MSPENSEYDSADSYSDEEQDVKIRSRASDLEEHSNSDTGGSVILEREEGDGQESLPTKKVDDDEDKKNPQYIPKRGTFYEHDDRTAEDVETNEKAEIDKDKDGKKKVWQDKKEKWSHDKFNDSEQAPKSRAELVAIYGYDIRNEEGPPRARRRRRYGRGPNKYTRTWEDEAAYTKTVPTPNRNKNPVRPKRNTEEFPPLVKDEEVNAQNDTDKKKEQIQAPKYQEKVETVRENRVSQPPVENQNQYNNIPINNQETQNNKTVQQRTGSGRIVKQKKEIKDSDHRGFTTKTRQLRNMKTDNQKVLPPRNQSNEEFIQTQNFTNKANNIQELEKEMNKLSVDGVYKGSKFNNQRQGSVPPRLQSEQKGSKRYSSMRQRSLPEANTPPAVSNYQHTFYPNEYNQQAAPTTSTQTLIHQPTPILHTTTQVTQIPPQPIPIPQQVTPVTAAPLLQAPFPVPPQAFPQPPPTAFLQPGVAPPPIFPPQTPQIINFVQGQPAFTPSYPSFQQQFNPVTQPTELYQPQGGITYYSTDQQVAQRPVPQKRPKAAIPIVAPPSDNRREELSLGISQSKSINRNDNIESVEVQE